MKTTARKGIKNKLEKLVKDYVKQRDNYTCLRCGKKLEKNNCHASHIMPVSAGIQWAYDVENIITLCFRCHIMFWHKNPLEANEWLKKEYPNIYKKIQVKKTVYKPRPIKTWELEELYESLKTLQGDI